MPYYLPRTNWYRAVGVLAVVLPCPPFLVRRRLPRYLQSRSPPLLAADDLSCARRPLPLARFGSRLYHLLAVELLVTCLFSVYLLITACRPAASAWLHP